MCDFFRLLAQDRSRRDAASYINFHQRRIFFLCLLPVAFIYKYYFILPSTQHSAFFFLFIILYSALHVSTTVGHLQMLQFSYTRL
jgi:hypothetical protein